MYDVAIIGNGVIGLLTALKLLEIQRQIRIVVIGPNGHTHSASLAAGAMHAVYCEIEHGIENSKFEQFLYSAGLQSRSHWKAIFKDIDSSDKILTAENTLLFLKKGHSEFEYMNFKKALERAEQDGVATSKSLKWINSTFPEDRKTVIEEAIQIEDEFGFDVSKLIASLINKLENKVDFINSITTNVESFKGGWEIRDSSKDIRCKANRIVICNGSEVNKVIPEGVTIQQVLKGVGTAFELSTERPINPQRMVIRSVNRGGSQCGIHFVPRGATKSYVGAGNFISLEGVTPGYTRVDTLRYLLDQAGSDITGTSFVYGATGRPVVGYRPRSLDGLPLIGSPAAADSIFIATGTNRIGITVAPVIAESICKWYRESDYSKEIPEVFAPDRKLVSYGSQADAITYFVNSRLANLHEHGLLSYDSCNLSKRKELEEFAKDTISKVNTHYGLDKNFTVDPDLWGVLMKLPQISVP
jgi:glycine/D-amino acid oxidase-like deaminating enzyme